METRVDMTDSGRGKKSCLQGRLPLQVEVAWATACYAALLALCALCYSNSLQGEFVHDDVWAIVNNPDVRPGSSLRNIFSNDFWGKRMADNTSHKSYRPLCILTFNLSDRKMMMKRKRKF
ncbi:Protein O-mannosyl-transferase tmtc1 [Characodon lateralis]|uniref:Protein O-mannosyl-transferase tmtc1 n=1 Tax=Characodon lateralis TaxID=208331 RepID=A0ABU7DYB1_9TELE|nr:Protein O-mannosyl-transferase tmtc1 [Characodon lateralis]